MSDNIEVSAHVEQWPLHVQTQRFNIWRLLIVSDKMICNVDQEAEKKFKSVRSKDLATRERVNFVLSSELMDTLRQKSIDEQIPMSRIIDAALIQYLKRDTEEYRKASLSSGVPLRHLLEIMLLFSHNSDETKKYLDLVKSSFSNFTYSSCLFKTDGKTIVGTKVILYLADSDNEVLGKFIDKISNLDYARKIKVLLDGKDFQC